MILSSEASLKEASANLEKTFIYSPVDGTVYKMNVEKVNVYKVFRAFKVQRSYVS